MRGKGDSDAFFGKFWENWKARAWESGNTGSGSGSGSTTQPSGSGSDSGSGLYAKDGTIRMVGVSGILRREQEMLESTDRNLQDAFQDLNALMVRKLLLPFIAI